MELFYKYFVKDAGRQPRQNSKTFEVAQINLSTVTVFKRKVGGTPTDDSEKRYPQTCFRVSDPKHKSEQMKPC